MWQPAPHWLGRCQYNVTGWDRSHGLPAVSPVWRHDKLSDVSLGTRPRYSLVVDEDVKKQKKQQKKNKVNRVSAVHVDVCTLSCEQNLLDDYDLVCDGLGKVWTSEPGNKIP